MNIAIMCHNRKQELMVQFCTAYCGLLSKHTLCATNATGRMVAEATGLPVNLFLSHEHGGIEQIGQRIIYNEIDMVLFFNYPQDTDMDDSVMYITRLCDQHSVPMATNVATAEMLIHGLDELNTVVKYLASFGVSETHFAVDLTIARGLDYYTGTVYETTMLDHPEIGSICSGGRYDNLAEYYTEKQLPGVGISIGLTRLFFVLEDQGYLNDALNTAPADVLILPMTDDLSPAIALATQLREAGIRTQIHGEQKKFKQKISYADKLSIPYAVFLGEDEISSGVCAVKDLATGEQVKLSPADAIAHIQAGLKKRNQGTPILDRGE